MTKTIKIMNYAGNITPIKIKKFEDVVRMTIEVESGDEILKIIRKDYSTEEYDSAYLSNNPRMYDFYDDEYDIYDITKNKNYLKKWSKRTSSYNYKLEDKQLI